MNHRQRLNNLLRDLKKKGIEGKSVIIPETPESRQTHEDVTQYLDKLDEFEKASRKTKIIVGGPGCYCHHENFHHYPNYY